MKQFVCLLRTRQDLLRRMFFGEEAPPSEWIERGRYRAVTPGAWPLSHPEKARASYRRAGRTPGISPEERDPRYRDDRPQPSQGRDHRDRRRGVHVRCGRHIGDVIGVYGGLQQPSAPNPSEITRLTGITDEMVAGQMIDLHQLHAIIEPADLIIAHNAGFDRQFCEAFSSIFAGRHGFARARRSTGPPPTSKAPSVVT